MPAVLLLQLLLAACAASASASFIDITVPVSAGMPVFQSANGLAKNWRSQHQVKSEGDVCNQSTFVLDGENSDM
jgi:hypothetical protein